MSKLEQTPILSSSDYETFSFFTGINRKVSKASVEGIKESIEKNGFDKDHAILVTKSKKIIDGQHRFLAARDLKIPVIYKVFNGTEKEAIALMRDLNVCTSPWKLSDYHRYYSSFDHPNREVYEFLTVIAEEYSIPVNTVYAIFFQKKIAKQNTALVKHGLISFKMCSKDDLRARTDSVKGIIEQLQTCCPKYDYFFNSGTCVQAILLILQFLPFEEFKERIITGRSKLLPCRTVNQYVEMFEEVVNAGRRVKTVLTEYINAGGNFDD